MLRKTTKRLLEYATEGFEKIELYTADKDDNIQV